MYSFTSALVRKRIGHPIKPPTQSYSTAQPPPSIASEEVEELPSDIFTELVDVTKREELFSFWYMIRDRHENIALNNNNILWGSYHIGTEVATSGYAGREDKRITPSAQAVFS